MGVQEGEPSEMMTRCVSEQNAALTLEKAPTSALRAAVVHLGSVDCGCGQEERADEEVRRGEGEGGLTQSLV